MKRKHLKYLLCSGSLATLATIPVILSSALDDPLKFAFCGLALLISSLLAVAGYLEQADEEANQ
jgi:hypothetical protein